MECGLRNDHTAPRTSENSNYGGGVERLVSAV
jgi:hypothetical protein